MGLPKLPHVVLDSLEAHSKPFKIIYFAYLSRPFRVTEPLSIKGLVKQPARSAQLTHLKDRCTSAAAHSAHSARLRLRRRRDLGGGDGGDGGSGNGDGPSQSQQIVPRSRRRTPGPRGPWGRTKRITEIAQKESPKLCDRGGTTQPT